MHKPEPNVESIALDRAQMEQLTRILQSLRYGVVELTIHEGRIVQIERREKFRFDANGNRLR
jgi:hypothetical protein